MTVVETNWYFELIQVRKPLNLLCNMLSQQFMEYSQNTHHNKNKR